MNRWCGARRASSMAVNGVRSATKKSPTFTGRQARGSVPCGCSWWRPSRISRRAANGNTIGIRLSCSLRTLRAHRASCSRHTSIRWQIEVNHREEKDTLGIGQAQLRSRLSVPRQPAFAVAAYSALHLAALLTFGPHRDTHYPALPKWRRNAARPSCLDLITLVRKDMAENPSLLAHLGFKIAWHQLGLAAAA